MLGLGLGLGPGPGPGPGPRSELPRRQPHNGSTFGFQSRDRDIAYHIHSGIRHICQLFRFQVAAAAAGLDRNEPNDNHDM